MPQSNFPRNSHHAPSSSDDPRGVSSRRQTNQPQDVTSRARARSGSRALPPHHAHFAAKPAAPQLAASIGFRHSTVEPHVYGLTGPSPPQNHRLTPRPVGGASYYPPSRPADLPNPASGLEYERTVPDVCPSQNRLYAADSNGAADHRLPQQDALCLYRRSTDETQQHSTGASGGTIHELPREAPGGSRLDAPPSYEPPMTFHPSAVDNNVRFRSYDLAANPGGPPMPGASRATIPPPKRMNIVLNGYHHAATGVSLTPRTPRAESSERECCLEAKTGKVEEYIRGRIHTK